MHMPSNNPHTPRTFWTRRKGRFGTSGILWLEALDGFAESREVLKVTLPIIFLCCVFLCPGPLEMRASRIRRHQQLGWNDPLVAIPWKDETHLVISAFLKSPQSVAWQFYMEQLESVGQSPVCCTKDKIQLSSCYRASKLCCGLEPDWALSMMVTPQAYPYLMDPKQSLATKNLAQVWRESMYYPETYSPAVLNRTTISKSFHYHLPWSWRPSVQLQERNY